MKKLLAQHKGFGIPVGGGLAVAAAWYLLLFQPLRASTEEQRLRFEQARLQSEGLAAGVATAEALAEAEADLGRRQKDLAALAERMSFTLPDWARSAVENRKAGFEFESRAPTEAEQFGREMKIKTGATQPLGFTLERPAEPVAREHLIRLMAVVRVLQAMRQSGVLEVSRIDPFLDRPARDEPVFHDGLFVNGLKIGVTFEGPSKAVFEALHRIQLPRTGDPYVAILKFETGQKQQGRDLLEAKLEAAVLEVKADGALVLQPEEQP